MSVSDEEVRKDAEWYRSCTTPIDGLMIGELMRIDQLAEWAVEELARRDAEVAERACSVFDLPLGTISGSVGWRLEHQQERSGKTVIVLVDRVSVECVVLRCIKTKWQLNKLIEALKGGET